MREGTAGGGGWEEQQYYVPDTCSTPHEPASEREEERAGSDRLAGLNTVGRCSGRWLVSECDSVVAGRRTEEVGEWVAGVEIQGGCRFARPAEATKQSRP